MRNIVMMHRRAIAEKIYAQMMRHFTAADSLIEEEIVGAKNVNYAQTLQFKETCNIFSDGYSTPITSVLFDGIEHGVFSAAKFDSQPELRIARLLEHAGGKWLRPVPTEFNLTYSGGHRYRPDFVIETANVIYLTEVKGMHLLDAPDTLAKRARGSSYCAAAMRRGRANDYKDSKYLFLPEDAIRSNSTLDALVKKYVME